MAEIHLSDYFEEESINLELAASDKDGVLEEMVALLPLDSGSRNIALELVRSREALGSTGIGNGIAIPHLRSTIFSRIMLAYGRSEKGVDYDSVDGEPANYFFLVASPPIDPTNLYHPILAKIVRLVKTEQNREQLQKCGAKAELLNLVDQLTD